eukprot:PLAT9851.1.p2 GENE.PLAT9851.1~~PLAT9851.1.p2  ORF type:complete len:283 (+),score=97.34 PLAT9851.1:43-891(+)
MAESDAISATASEFLRAEEDIIARMGGMSIDTELIEARQELFDRLVEDHPTSVGKSLSKKERHDKELTASTLVYGEIKFDSFAIAFEKIKKVYGGLAESGGVFYDLGCGTGKPVFAACLMHDFARAKGIEILGDMIVAADEMLCKWDSDIRGELPEAWQEQDISFMAGDILVEDWSDADVLFANSTCFDDRLMKALASRAVHCKPGTFFITFTKALPSDKWEVLESKRYQMSWGEATVYIQRRLPKSEEEEAEDAPVADTATAKATTPSSDADDAADGAAEE